MTARAPLKILPAILIATALPAAAQVEPDAPCMSPFLGAGYPAIDRLVPREAPPPAAMRIRGVVVRTVLWRPGETLQVCFRSGTQKARDRIAKIATEWEQYVNLRLDFGPEGNRRTCSAENREAIKIDFVSTGPKAGNWSLLGVQSRSADHSMNFFRMGEDEPPRGLPEDRMRGTVLHEFGHALGLLHEHQSPRSDCAVEYYEEAVFAYGALMGWPKEQTIRNFKLIAETKEINATEIDRKSIMHYSMPPWLFKKGEQSDCFVKPNTVLSEQDKAFMSSHYPKPVAMTTRGAAPSGGAGSSPEALLAAYTKELGAAGVSGVQAEKLIREFRALLDQR